MTGTQLAERFNVNIYNNRGSAYIRLADRAKYERLLPNATVKLEKTRCNGKQVDYYKFTK